MAATPELTLVPVGAGKLALTHRPKKRSIPTFREVGITHLITLLTEREGAKDIGSVASIAGLTWIWCPLEGADTNASAEIVRAALETGRAALADGGAVAIHCSAGIHRTGMFGYALLRFAGLERELALTKLGELRAVTAAGVGFERLEWGDRIAAALAEPRS